jgi:hypothetical protein
VKELRDRARRFKENGEGLEKTSGTLWATVSGGSEANTMKTK